MGLSSGPTAAPVLALMPWALATDVQIRKWHPEKFCIPGSWPSEGWQAQVRVCGPRGFLGETQLSHQVMDKTVFCFHSNKSCHCYSILLCVTPQNVFLTIPWKNCTQNSQSRFLNVMDETSFAVWMSQVFIGFSGKLSESLIQQACRLPTLLWRQFLWSLHPADHIQFAELLRNEKFLFSVIPSHRRKKIGNVSLESCILTDWRELEEFQIQLVYWACGGKWVKKWYRNFGLEPDSLSTRTEEWTHRRKNGIAKMEI